MLFWGRRRCRPLRQIARGEPGLQCRVIRADVIDDSHGTHNRYELFQRQVSYTATSTHLLY
jgi:hypothetical protein